MSDFPLKTAPKAVEAISSELGNRLKELLESKHIYQRIRVDAEKVLNAVRGALAVPDPTDLKAQIRLGDIIADVVKSGEPIPEPDAVRQLLNLDMIPNDLPNVAEYLTRWLKGRKKIKAGTRRSYEAPLSS